MYEDKEQRFGAEAMSEMASWVLLRTIDAKWRDHLYEMDYLREGIGLRALAQRDPLVEYKNEGFQLFQEMMESIQRDFVRYVFHLEIVKEEEPQAAPARQLALLGRRRQRPGPELRGHGGCGQAVRRRRQLGRGLRSGPGGHPDGRGASASATKWGATIPARAAAGRSTRSAAARDGLSPARLDRRHSRFHGSFILGYNSPAYG